MKTQNPNGEVFQEDDVKQSLSKKKLEELQQKERDTRVEEFFTNPKEFSPRHDEKFLYELLVQECDYLFD